MIGAYIVLTALIFLMAGIVIGWCLHTAHLDFIKRVVEAVKTAHVNYDKDKEQETP